MRREYILDKDWEFRKDCGSISEMKDVDPENIAVPHTWNNIDGQDGGNDYFRGTCCYRKVFSSPDISKDEQVYLEFDAVSASSMVYVNGVPVRSHEGGYSAFQVRIDEYLRAENELVVFADNGINDRIYPQTADFTFYGGIYRDVRMIVVSPTHFEFGPYGGRGLKLTPTVLGNKGILRAESWISGSYDKVVFTVFDKEREVCSFEGPSGEISIDNVHLWNGLDDPFLYTVRAEVYVQAEVSDRLELQIGFRFFEIDSQKGFFLNGRSCPLRGVSRHQDREGVGNAITRKMQEEDLSLILECGANSIRLAHYQHDQYFYDLCDRAGILCWAEIPYITKHMDNGVENTILQMSEMIEQCYNHACIFCWGISNEITAGGNGEKVYENNLMLYNLCHRMDTTRPVAMAHAFMLSLNDRIVSLPDIMGYNLYYGWYLGNIEGNGSFLDSCHGMHPELPVGLTEFGCDANIKLQTSKPARGDYSEQYQARFHEVMCREIDSRQYLWGTFVWNMFDFAADARDEGGVRGRNCKGLVTFDRKKRKDSFYVIKAWYSKDPFVRIAGSRYVNRCEDVSEIRVYSNQNEVELFCNGKSFGKQKGEHVFVFNVVLEDRNEIEAVSGSLSDSINISKVSVPDPDYQLVSASNVQNWFDGLELSVNDGRYSINDTVGEILKTKEGQDIFRSVMEKRKKMNSTDVATQVEIPREMMLMTLKDVPFAELLRRSAFHVDYVRLINERLREIPKV